MILFAGTCVIHHPSHGCVAKTTLPAIEPIPLFAGIDCSALQSEGFTDELNRPKDIPFGQPPTRPFRITCRTS